MLKLIFNHILMVAIFIIAVEQSKDSPIHNQVEELVPRIVNGTSAKQGQFPWHVSLLKEDHIFCAGTLITTKTVLTAAHCISSVKVPNIYGLIGDVHWRYAKTLYFSNIIIHENFNFSSDSIHVNDIGLLILTNTIKLSDRIKTIALPRKYMIYRGVAAVAGLATSCTATTTYPEKLQFVNMNIIQPEICLPGSMAFVCATANSKGPCWDDSGTSLIYSKGEGHHKMSIGVYTANAIYTYPGTKAYFTATSYYAKWLASNAEGQLTFVI